MKCNCKDWKDNIDKLNSAFNLLGGRNPQTYKGYEGMMFRYCPWCSKELLTDESNGQ